MVKLNRTAVDAIQNYLKHDRYGQQADNDGYLFYSRFAEVLTVPTVTNMVTVGTVNASIKPLRRSAMRLASPKTSYD